MHTFKKVLTCLFLLLIFSCSKTEETSKDFTTLFETSKGTETPEYADVIAYYKNLAQAYNEIIMFEFGETDSGFPLHLVVYNAEGSIKKEDLKTTTKNRILVNNGIHPGESDGIDASMLLLRDIVQNDSLQEVYKNSLIAVIPAYNIGGSLNRNSYSRANQNGPLEYGFRGNARNYDLNRDFVKQDTKNAAAFAEIFHTLNPDVFVDNHVSNGADYQYAITHLFTQHNKLGGDLGKFMRKKMQPEIEESLNKKGVIITPYVNVWGGTIEGNIGRHFKNRLQMDVFPNGEHGKHAITHYKVFFVILLLLFIANEFLRKRISNKYLQFGFYFFVNFIFVSCFLPVILSEMSVQIFLISGILSLSFTLFLIYLVYKSSETARTEIVKYKMVGLIVSIYFLINIFYFAKLIPPVPLVLENGLVAYNIDKKNSKYVVTYEADSWYNFWRNHKKHFSKQANEPVYIFTSIFAPNNLKKNVIHRWKWFNEKLDDWVVVEDISFEIMGGRENGFRGYTYKNNVNNGDWKVEVITKEELVIGVVDFTINKMDNTCKSFVIKEF